VFLYFLSIGILYYKEGHMDEVKIIKSIDLNLFPTIHKQKLLAGQPDNVRPSPRKPQTLTESPS
jgi:hypothetical protein